MEESRIVEIKEDILADNTNAANAFRKMLENQGTFFVDVMASPGAGKTTLLLALIEELRKSASIGIIEADLESFVDSRKIKDAGIQAVQLETRGICHVEMSMVERAFRAFGGQHFDYLFLENIGNLVCPAEFDTGAVSAHLRSISCTASRKSSQSQGRSGRFLTYRRATRTGIQMERS